MPSLCANRSHKELRACCSASRQGPIRAAQLRGSKGLPSCDARPPRQNHWPPIKINPLVIAATDMIGTQAPPERQRIVKQPAAELFSFRNEFAQRCKVRIMHRSATRLGGRDPAQAFHILGPLAPSIFTRRPQGRDRKAV